MQQDPSNTVLQENEAHHVLQVIPALNSGGVERGTIEVAQYLSSQGIRNSVVSEGGTMVEQLDACHSAHLTLPVASKLPWHILRNAFTLAAVIKAQGVDLIHVRSRAPAWSCLFASKLTGVPYVSTFHGCYGHKSAIKRFYNSAMLRGRACIAVSAFIGRHIQHTYAAHLLASNKVTLINRGVDTRYFSKQETSDQLDAPRTRLLIPGRISRIKGHALLADALEQITDIQLDITLVGSAQGNTTLETELIQRFSALRHTVHFVEHQKDIRPFYNHADIVISASTKPESFGRTLIEAQAMECMVVAPDQGANRDIIAPDLHIGLFKPKDANDLALAILRVSQLKADLRAAYSAKARYFVEANFKLSQMVKKTLELYQQVWQDCSQQNNNN